MSNLTIKQLRYVEAAARTGSISAAATSLNISQSSITAAIDALEAETDFDLFTRVPAKGLMVTPAGQQSVALIANILAAFREFESELAAVGGTSRGVIRLACFAAAASVFLPPAIAGFQKRNPGIRFEIVEGNMDNVVNFLEEGLADIAFTYREVVLSSQIFYPLIDLPHFALLSIQDPQSEQPSITLKELSKKPMIQLKLAQTRTYYGDLFKHAGMEVETAHWSSSVEMVRTMVAANFGFTVLNAKPLAAIGGRGGFRAVPISDPLQPRSFGMVMQARVRQPRAVVDFHAHCDMLRARGHFDLMAVRATL